VCSLCTFYRGVTSVIGFSKTGIVRSSLNTVLHLSNVRGVVAHLEESRSLVGR
jgi:hypothetical protein